jgi:hypothetical protein
VQPIDALRPPTQVAFMNHLLRAALAQYPIKNPNGELTGKWDGSILAWCTLDNVMSTEQNVVEQYYGVDHHTDMYHADGDKRELWGFNGLRVVQLVCRSS